MLLLNKFVDIKENEAVFQKALAENNTDIMWECCFIACTNLAKRIYANRGFIAQEDDLYDVIINSTMMVMRNITEKGHKPTALSAYCWTRVLCHVNGYGEDKFVRRLRPKLSSINRNEMLLNKYIEEELVSEENIEEEGELDNNE